MFSSKHGYPDLFLVLDQLEAVFSSKHGYPDVFLVLDQLEAVSRTKHGYPDVSLIVLDQLEAVFSSKHGGPDVFLPCPAAQMALLPRGMEGEGGSDKQNRSETRARTIPHKGTEEGSRGWV